MNTGSQFVMEGVKNLVLKQQVSLKTNLKKVYHMSTVNIQKINFQYLCHINKISCTVKKQTSAFAGG